MTRKLETPVRTPEDRFGHWTETHPAFAQLQLFRTSGGRTHMYGSHLPKHNSWVTFKLIKSERYHSNGEDRHYGHKTIAEFSMTFAQFSSMLAAMNQGEGVPVTLEYVREGNVVDVPEIYYPEETDSTEGASSVATLKANAAKAAKSIEDLEADVMAILESNKTTGKLKEAVRSAFARREMEIKSNLPFFVEQVLAAGERVVSSVKNEIDASIQHVVNRLGFKALRDIADAPNKQIGKDDT